VVQSFIKKASDLLGNSPQFAPARQSARVLRKDGSRHAGSLDCGQVAEELCSSSLEEYDAVRQSLPWAKSGLPALRRSKRSLGGGSFSEESTICSHFRANGIGFMRTRLREGRARGGSSTEPRARRRRQGRCASDEGSSDLDLTPGSLEKQTIRSGCICARWTVRADARGRSHHRQAYRARATGGDESITRSPIVIKN